MTKSDESEMPEEIDFSKGVRGKYAGKIIQPSGISYEQAIRLLAAVREVAEKVRLTEQTMVAWLDSLPNPNCSGSGPHIPGEVRVMPTGSDGNMIFCRACWEREVQYRRERNISVMHPVAYAWELPAWESAEVYGSKCGVKWKNEHWKADGTCDCTMDGTCCECGNPCNDHDLVGNQIEFGFPKYWCGECVNKALDKDAEMAIETLDYVIAEICDALGLYGACDEDCDLHDGDSRDAAVVGMCRSHATANLAQRIRAALVVEDKLAK